MKKTEGMKALAKEALFWNALKLAAKQNPGSVCHK